MNQENQINNQFIYDLYDNIGCLLSNKLKDFNEEQTKYGRRTIYYILESINNIMDNEVKEQKNENYIDYIDDYLIDVTIQEIAKCILDIQFNSNTDDTIRDVALAVIKHGLKNCVHKESLYTSYISEVLPLYCDDKDIEVSSCFKELLEYILKKIYIRGF